MRYRQKSIELVQEKKKPMIIFSNTFGDMPNGISNRSSKGVEVAFESIT